MCHQVASQIVMSRVCARCVRAHHSPSFQETPDSMCVPFFTYTHTYTYTCIPGERDTHTNAQMIAYTHTHTRTHTMTHGCVCSTEFPGYGLCKGQPCEASVNRAVLAACQFARDSLMMDPSRIIIYGRSAPLSPLPHRPHASTAIMHKPQTIFLYLCIYIHKYTYIHTYMYVRTYIHI
jgi:hypothetical protein